MQKIKLLLVIMLTYVAFVNGKKRESGWFASEIDTISIFIASVKATFIHVKAGRVSMTDLISRHISANATRYSQSTFKYSGTQSVLNILF